MSDDPARAALEYLADPENWLGDPLSQESTLHGHDTPYELAVAALALEPRYPETANSFYGPDGVLVIRRPTP
ncbi:MAG: hypothetical protein ABSG93_18915 [Solirubrobacteraceae bacterium]|jgi:hypothetical protein